MCVTNQACRLDMHMMHSIMCNSCKVEHGMHGSLCKAASSEVWANSLAMQDSLWQTQVTQTTEGFCVSCLCKPGYGSQSDKLFTDNIGWQNLV